MTDAPQKANTTFELFGHVITPSEIQQAEEELEGSDATREIVLIVALLGSLAVSTHDHASDLVAEGFVLRAEECDQRSILYANTRGAIIGKWKYPSPCAL